MSRLIQLPSEELLSLMQQYQEDHIATPAVTGFDYEIEQEAYEQLAGEWKNGWDFCTTFDHFGDRGASIPIQNARIDWQGLSNWLVEKCSALPEGAMINFEVWDNIQDGTMVAGEMLLRRLILSSGVYSELTALRPSVGNQNE